MQLLSLLLLVGFAFLPGAISWFFAWAVWTSNKRPQLALWRVRMFQWGILCAPISIVVLAPGCAHYLKTGGPPDWALGLTNWMGLLLLVFSLIAALTGRGRSRACLCASGALAILGCLAVYMIVP